MQDESSQLGAPARRTWRVIALGAAFACGCATGVDITDDELAALCAESGARCTPVSGSGGSSGALGNAGTTSSVGGSGFGNAGSTFSATGGRAGSVSSGGSGGGSAGTPGTSGNAGSGSAPLAEGDCLDVSDVTILYRDRTNGAASSNEPSMVLSVQNSGAAFDLTDLTLRYWFTADGGSNFTGNVDYAALDAQTTITGSVTLSFGQELGSDYVELGFTQGGSVGASGVREVQLRFHSDPYQSMTQTNDFSFLSGAGENTPNPNITPYVNGNQVGGCTPQP